MNHKAIDMDPVAGTIRFENGETATADLIVAADGIRVCILWLSCALLEASILTGQSPSAEASWA